LAREYRGFSQDEVAKYLGLSRSAISLIESGGRRLDILEAQKLAKLFECTSEELTGAESSGGSERSVNMVARATASLSPEDRSEVLRFAQFLRSRKERSES
jgi:transcriptional regulator with XRE-family HTH domain